ncbi:hypothetical protein GCM10011343_18410 [Flavobacterium orientale]|uniref:Lipopolysaccharide kinase (Kdo/WaaP) family protein n=2 Tax=Flavobacterium orientale TaxID=1756020 RepID=A0A916Y2N1_9FLAO|nr:hypothetical protein GCM10011343_18410 [Flavobacterium orientale]
MYNFEHSSDLDKTSLLEIIDKSQDLGEVLVRGSRNTLKVLDYNGLQLTIKSFKVPNLINKVVYKFFRKSKARRSFEHAKILLQKGINTPKPIAYFEELTFFGIRKSYYVSDYLNYDFSIREVFMDKNFPNRKEIIIQFTQFTFKLHEVGVEFLDHSPGNTLIKVNENGAYDFYLVDLNRMKFHSILTFKQRMKNFSRLSLEDDVLKHISSEYAKLNDVTFDKVYSSMSSFVNQFTSKNEFKKQLKNKLLFYRN